MPRNPGGPYRVDLQNPVADHPLNRGLVSWWLPLPHLFGGNRLWDLCNRNHGTLTSGPVWRGGATGFGSVDYDGASSVRNIAASGLPAVNSAKSIVVWSKLDTNPSGYAFLYCGGNGAGSSIQFGFNSGGGYAARPGGAGGDYVTASSTPAAGLWHGYVYTYDGTNHTLYADAVQVGTNTTASQVGTQSQFSMGKYNLTDFDGQGIDGLIQSVSVYNRALSPVEVRALYDQSLRGHPDTLRRYPERSWFVLRESGEAASGDIASAVSLAITGSGIQTGAGALAIVVPLVITTTSIMVGAGTVAGTAPLAVTTDGIIVGAGPTAGAVSLTVSAESTGVGAAVLAVVAPLAITVTAAPVGDGVFAAAVPLALTTAGIADGAGTVAGIAAAVWTDSATAVGTGTLAAVTSTLLTVSTALTGDAAVSGAVTVVWTATAIFDQSSLTGSAALVIVADAVVGGAGVLLAGTPIIVSAVGVIDAAAMIAAVIEFSMRFVHVQDVGAQFAHVQPYTPRFPHVQPDSTGFAR